MTLGTRTDFVVEFAEAAKRFAVAVLETHPREPVPACPGWSTYDLVVHLGNTHAWAATIVETGRAAAEQDDEPDSHKPRAMREWYAAKAEDLYRVLQAADPEAACWNFTGRDLTPRFWSRRQTHETLVHLVDLDQASGRTTELPARVCVDAIAEVLSVMMPRMYQRGVRVELTEPLCIRTTDGTSDGTATDGTDGTTGGPDSWTLLPHGDRPPAVRPGIWPGADLLEGTAAALMCLLWGRFGPDDPRVSWVGDIDRISTFLASPVTP